MTVSFIIPFHNEEKNCRPAIERIVKFAGKNRLKYEVIPVDDRSTDKTTLILKFSEGKVTKAKAADIKDESQIISVTTEVSAKSSIRTIFVVE